MWCSEHSVSVGVWYKKMYNLSEWFKNSLHISSINSKPLKNGAWHFGQKLDKSAQKEIEWNNLGNIVTYSRFASCCAWNMNYWDLLNVSVHTTRWELKNQKKGGNLELVSLVEALTHENIPKRPCHLSGEKRPTVALIVYFWHRRLRA